ncbi:membrane dipeptidase [Variovorax sp. LjRoot178]|uniref:membrane dipeptidase n=1 Tax=Variovorax sp. LjRoot178 TaxID=3342277 RepID=UPI003ED14520
MLARGVDGWVERTLDASRQDAIEVLVRGILAASVHPTIGGFVDALIATAIGVDSISKTLRAALLGRAIPDPVDTLDPRIPNTVLVDAEKLARLVFWGTVAEYFKALRELGMASGSYANWTSRARAHADGIASIAPARGCAGNTITIGGVGFLSIDWTWTRIRFPDGRGGCLEATVVGSPTDTEIVVTAPDGVGIGCVGFLVLPGAPPSDPMTAAIGAAQAAGMLQSVMGDQLGSFGVLLGQVIVDSVAHASIASLPCPPCLPSGANAFAGGPPVIRSFTVNGAHEAVIHPGDTVSLAWKVENADTVTINARSGATGMLPPIGLVAPDGIRLEVIPWDGIDDWDLEYTLEAVNPCGSPSVAEFVIVRMREHPPLFGIADTHVHFAAHLGFGGFGVFGRPFDSTVGLTGEQQMARALAGCGGLAQHGPGGLFRSLEVGHDAGGWPTFHGWPRHTTFSHQQCYIDWIKRAHDGGLRLVVCLAVNNEFLAQRLSELFGPGGAPSVDDAAISAQIAEMQAMVDFVDMQAGGPGMGWMELVKAPIDARRVVGAGKLAIVIGVEVDSLGGWHTESELESAALTAGKSEGALIAELVDDLYAKGVRHLFPVHATDNPFGGAALFVKNYDAANFVLTGSSFDVSPAPQALGIAYRVDQDGFTGGAVAELLGYYGINQLNGATNGALGRLLNALPAVIAAAIVIAPALAGTSVASAPVLIGLAIGMGPALPAAILATAAGLIAAAAPVILPELANLANLAFLPCPPLPTNWAATEGGHINSRGLTRYGRALLSEMMKHGMIIDIDHMGHAMTESVLEICEKRGSPYPVVSGHTSFRELKHGYFTSLSVPKAQFGTRPSEQTFGTYLGRALAGEVDKTSDHLRRIKNLHGMVSVFLYQRDILGCGCSQYISNDAAGTSKSFSQALLYANAKMKWRRVGIGTDANGAGQFPGPRFGTEASAAIAGDEKLWRARKDRGAPLRRDEVLSQRHGTRYTTPIVDYRGHHRFPTYGTHPEEHVLDQEQRDFWEAIAIWRSGTGPEGADQPSLFVRPLATHFFIVNLAKGLGATNRSQLPMGLYGAGLFTDADEQLAAFLVKEGQATSANEPQRVRDLTSKFRVVWEHWQAMEEGRVLAPTIPYPEIASLYSADGRMTRSTAGDRDWDINLDGMAHYGLLPDFLQDVRNVGVGHSELATLYRSAEDYIRVWERCEARKGP